MQIRILAIVLLLAAAFASPADTAAQMCRNTGNVELTITPELKSSSWVAFTFVNSNQYPVTINASITLRDVDGNEKKLARTIVVNAGASKELKFHTNNVGMNYFSPYDCSCLFFPSKCD
ncbi:MAG: hypothetical protein NC406_09810 [Bacteroides sp.]|nr:hypothetical protein [Bacteroides sp.]MCM1096162.1 hypothetical protein [Terasakiella sp.]